MPVLRRLTPLAALVAVTVAFIILPIASSAFLGDDQFNSSINGSLRDSGLSVGQVAWQTTIGFFRSTSRFVPGFYYQAYGLFHYVPVLAEYKAIQVTMYALDFVLFVLLLRALGIDAALTSAAVLISLTAIQFYGHYDAYLGFSATAPYWLALTIGSWLAFAVWLRSQQGNWGRRIAVLLTLLSVLTYETLYPMSIGHLLIAMQIRGRAAWREAWPFLALSGLAVAQIGVARVIYPQPVNALYSLHVFTFEYFRTVFYQVTASLPLVHLAFFRDSLFPPGVSFWSATPWWLLCCVAAVSGVASFGAFRALGATPVRRLVLPAALGVWLWVEAALLLAAIPRYQIEVQPGHGYGPMALGGFGAAIVLACALAAVVSRIPPQRRIPAAAVLAALYAVVLTASFETNERTLVMYEGERAALINLSDALDDGVAAAVPDGATLLSDSPLQIMNRFDAMRDNRHGLDNPHYFVREHSGRAVFVRSIYETPSAVSCGTENCRVSNTYALHDVPLDVRDGFTAVGRVSRVARLGDGTLHPWMDDISIYVRGDRIADLSERGGIVVGYTCAADGTQRSASLPLAPAAIRRGATARIVTTCPADMTTLQVAAAG
jgi:hypothetical protein